MFGLLNINKSAGCSSRDVVNRVQRLVKPVKVGHAGTLDPLATGVLVVCLGPATRLISYVQEMPKQYLATFLLGQSSPSDDTETEITQLAQPTIPTLADIEAVLPQFLGTIQQVPPAYSAIKVQGQRAYHLARRGQRLELKPRPVAIYGLEVVAYEYPRLELQIDCGSGTYVRSLGRDLARELGTAAVMSALVRTAIGRFSFREALAFDQITQETLAANLQPARLAVEHLATITLSQEQIEEIRNGRLIEATAIAPQDSMPDSDSDSEVAALDAQGRLVALLREKQPGRLGPVRNFAPSERPA